MNDRTKSAAESEGYPVVLTADRTLMAAYRLLFDGMLAASQTTSMPWPLMKRLLLPKNGGGAGGARVAPLGLRRIEAALIAGGFSTADVIVVDPDFLPEVIGPRTEIVGISSGEPAGLGMNTSTMVGIAGGRIYPSVMCERLLNAVRQLIAQRAPGARIVLGGPGAWQIEGNPSADTILVTGYAEDNVAELFSAIRRGEAQPVMEGRGPPADRIPRILGATTMGAVEISRGCGLGCDFCTIRHTPMQHLPPATILADVQTNLAAGIRDVALLSEDFFRYGATGIRPRPAALVALLEQLRGLPDLRLIQIDHANIMSVEGFDDAELKSVHDLMVGTNRHRYPWVNLGIESAVGRLLEFNGARAKMGGRSAGEWGDFCTQQIRRLCAAGFFPMISLMLRLPGETADDLRATLDWVQRLRDLRVSVFPVLYAPIDGSAPPEAGALTPLHWKLIRTCYAYNFTYIPRMYWDNQTGAGVHWSRRGLMQVLGNGQALQWNLLFAWHARRAARSEARGRATGERHE